MAVAETVKNAIEGLKIWEETHLADVHAELERLARREHAASEHAAEPAEDQARDAGGKFRADPGKD